MGHKKRGKYGTKIRPEVHYPPVMARKKGLSTGVKILIGLALIAVVVVGGTFALSLNTAKSPQPSTTNQGQEYPQNVAPVFYTTAQLTPNETTLSVPSSYVTENKLVFVDIRLQSSQQDLPYNGRNVPLASYKNGEYLPIVLISTPSGSTVAGIRTCEPCGSFSFHIVKGSNLKCDVCGTEWTLENFAPVSGGCGSYPPPKLPTTVNGDSIQVDLSGLGVNLQG